MIGKTTQAKLLSKLYRCPIIDINDFILNAIEAKKLVLPSQEKGEKNEKKEGKDNKEEKVGNGKASKDKTEDKSKEKTGKAKENENSRGKESEKSSKNKKGESLDGGKKESEKVQKGKNTETPDKPIVEKFTSFQNDVISLLRKRVDEDDCKAGFILDSVRSDHFTDSLTLVKCVLHALGLRPYTCNREAPIEELKDQVDGHGEIQTISSSREKEKSIIGLDKANKRNEGRTSSKSTTDEVHKKTESKLSDDGSTGSESMETERKGKKTKDKELKVEGKGNTQNQTPDIAEKISKRVSKSTFETQTKIIWKGDCLVHAVFLQSDRLGIENRFAKISETHQSKHVVKEQPHANAEDPLSGTKVRSSIESLENALTEPAKNTAINGLEKNGATMRKRSRKTGKDAPRKPTSDQSSGATEQGKTGKTNKEARKSKTKLTPSETMDEAIEETESEVIPQFEYPFISLFPNEEALEKYYMDEEKIVNGVGGMIPIDAAIYLGHQVHSTCLSGLQRSNLVFEGELHHLPVPGPPPPCPPSYTLQIVKRPNPERFASFIPNFVIHTAPMNPESKLQKKKSATRGASLKPQNKLQEDEATNKNKAKSNEPKGGTKIPNPKRTSKDDTSKEGSVEGKESRKKLEGSSFTEGKEMKKKMDPNVKDAKDKVKKDVLGDENPPSSKQLKEKKPKSTDDGGVKKASNKEKSTSGGKEKSGGGNPLANPQNGFENKTRWLIPPFGTVSLMLRFWSEEVGKFQQAFVYEILGGLGHAMLSATAVCAFPEVTMYKLVRKDKWSLPDTGKILLPNGGFIDFGPISIGPQPDNFLEVSYLKTP